MNSRPRAYESPALLWEKQTRHAPQLFFKYWLSRLARDETVQNNLFAANYANWLKSSCEFAEFVAEALNFPVKNGRPQIHKSLNEGIGTALI